MTPAEKWFKEHNKTTVSFQSCSNCYHVGWHDSGLIAYCRKAAKETNTVSYACQIDYPNDTSCDEWSE